MSLTVESLKELWAKEFLPNVWKEIRLEIDSLKASLLDLKKVKSQIKAIKEDINKLGNDGFKVEVKLDELKQYARRDCLEITGILVVPNNSPALFSSIFLII